MAQLNRGTIAGTVTDPEGAAIPGASITIRNPATGATIKAQANEYGQFSTPNLQPGTYEVIVEAPGFKRLSRQGITLGATEVRRVDVALEVGDVAESITVTGELPRLATDSPEVGTSIDTLQLKDLPLTFNAGREAEGFAYKLAPGVSGSSWATRINGSTEFSKESLLDGASVTTYLSGHFGESSVSVEALQELKVQTSGISAEFGRAQGGVFNYVMKSGTNTPHGSAYVGIRNEFFNSNGFVNNFRGLDKPRDRQKNYAASFGGPVYLPKVYNGRDRTFFYVAYERYSLRNEMMGAPSRTAPQPEWLDGDLSRLLGPALPNVTDALGRPVLRGAIYDPATFRQLPNGRWVGEMFPGNVIPVSRISKVSQRLNEKVRQGYLPTVRDANGVIPLENNQHFLVTSNPRFDQYQFSVKGDHLIGSDHRLSGSYAYNARPRLMYDGGVLFDANAVDGGPLSSARTQRIKTQMGRIAHDWTITPTVLNTINVHYNRQVNPNINAYAEVDGAKEMGIANLSSIAYPEINWGGGPFVSLSRVGNQIGDFNWSDGYGLLNTLSLNKGRHFIKLGIDVRRYAQRFLRRHRVGFNFSPLATAIPNETFAGNQTGYAFASYLLGIVDSGNWVDPSKMGGRRSYTALFIQDDFKVNNRLTLNLGLRWDYQPPFVEDHDRISSWSTEVIDPISGLKGAYEFAGKCPDCTGRRYFGKKVYTAFGPRFGFAFRPAGNWTLRGSYGIMYDADNFNAWEATPLGTATSIMVGRTYQFSADPVNRWAGIFNWDDGLPLDRFTEGSRDPSWGNFNRPGMIDPLYGTPGYIQMWSFNIQRELARNLVLDIGYVANKATSLKSELARLNQIRPEWMAQYGAALNNPVTNEAQAAANGIRYPFPGFRGTVASALRDYPQVQGNSTIRSYGTPLGFSTYHSLQVILNKEFSNGLTAYANYVWSKNLTNINSSLIGGDTGGLDYYNMRNYKSYSTSDMPHVFKGYISYDLPIGRGRPLLGEAGRVLNAIVGGWTISAIVNYASGTPLGFSASSPSSAWNGGGNVPNIAPGPLVNPNFDDNKFDFANPNSPNNTYLLKDKFSNPPALTLGTAARRYGSARRTASLNEDFGIQKNTMIREGVRFQIRAEMLNGFNRSRLGSPQTNVTSPTFGQITSISGNRQVQIAARLDF